MDAVQERLADEFESPVREQVGPWECLTVQEPGADEPYTWQVCVADAGKWLQVAEAYFPGPAEVTRYGAAIDASLLAGGES